MKTMHDPLAIAPHRPAAGARRLTARMVGVAGVVVVAFLLALIFAAYLRPVFALDLMNRFILCL